MNYSSKVDEVIVVPTSYTPTPSTQPTLKPFDDFRTNQEILSFSSNESKPIFNYIKPNDMSFKSGLESFSTNLGSISDSIVSAAESVKNVKLPPVKTQSSVGIAPTTFLGLGVLILLFIYLRKKL